MEILEPIWDDHWKWCKRSSRSPLLQLLEKQQISCAKGLLMGARGNSGVITPQLFRRIFSKCQRQGWMSRPCGNFQAGAEVAYKAAMKPAEGTIDRFSWCCHRCQEKKQNLPVMLSKSCVCGPHELRQFRQNTAGRYASCISEAGGGTGAGWFHLWRVPISFDREFIASEEFVATLATSVRNDQCRAPSP